MASKKFAPCQQYNGVQIEYLRNGHKFCRSKSRFASMKKSHKKPPILKGIIREKKSKKSDIIIKFLPQIKKHSIKKAISSKSDNSITMTKCLSWSKVERQQICQILNIPTQSLSSFNTCSKILDLIDNDSRRSLLGNIFYSVSLDDIKKICQLLEIGLRNRLKNKVKPLNQLLFEICQTISKYSTPEFKQVIKRLLGSNQQCNVTKGYIIAKIIINILYPGNFYKKAPIPITEQLYQKLIKMKKMGLIQTRQEEFLLEQSLHNKICHCVKETLIRNKFLREVLNKPTSYNAFAICTNSVYKQRGLPVPPSEIRNCPVFFDWYQKLNYITNKKKYQQQFQRQKDKSKKINLIEIQSGGSSDKNAFSPVDDCQQSQMEVKMMQWPNIYSNTNGWKGSGW